MCHPICPSKLKIMSHAQTKILESKYNTNSFQKPESELKSTQDITTEATISTGLISNVVFEKIHSWVKGGDQVKRNYKSQQCEFISTTNPIAAVTDDLYTTNLPRNPYVTQFSTNIIAFQLPYQSQRYLDSLKTLYISPPFNFDVQPIGKFLLWPPSVQTKNKKKDDAIVHGCIRLWLSRQNELSHKFEKRVKITEQKQKMEEEETKQRKQLQYEEFMKAKEHDRQMGINVDIDEKEMENNYESELKKLEEKRKRDEQRRELQAAEDMKKKPTAKDLKWGIKYLHNTKLPMNQNFHEISNETEFQKVDNPDCDYHYDKDNNKLTLRKNFRYQKMSDYMIPYEYAVVTYLEMFDEELINTVALHKYPGLKGIMKVSGFCANMQEAETLSKECNEQYDNCFSHAIVTIGMGAPYPPKKTYFQDLMIDNDKESTDSLKSKQFIKEFYQNKKNNKEVPVTTTTSNENVEMEIEKANEVYQSKLNSTSYGEDDEIYPDSFISPFSPMREDDDDDEEVNQ